VTADFVAKLRGLDSKNSQSELSIEKFLTKSEEAFFDKVKEDKRENAASLRSQRDSFYHSNTSRSSFYSTGPDCECPFLLMIYSYSKFVSAPSFADELGMMGGGDLGGATIVIPSRLQVFLSRELLGWPLYVSSWRLHRYVILRSRVLGLWRQLTT
jgi:alpha-1,3-glucan synthase